MSTMAYLFSNLPYLVPQIAVDAIGIFLGLSYMSRAKRPATFVLAGSALFLATTLVTTLITSVLIGGRPSNFTFMLGIVNFGANLVRVAGMGLLLAAAFVDRGAPAPAQGSMSDRVGKTCVSCGERGAIAARFCAQCGSAFSSTV